MGTMSRKVVKKAKKTTAETPSATAASHAQALGSEDAPETEQSIRLDRERTLRLLGAVLSQEAEPDELSEDEKLQPRSKRTTYGPEARKIFIGNLPWKAQAEEVQAYFEECGDIDSFNMPSHKQTGKPMGIAIIVYASRDSAERALAYNERTFCGRKLRVNFADPALTQRGPRKS
eukprot:TRINITY_DN19234_c0_g1_i2.p2 TRINITY_DN19234_c0_g1~~TRINITY_DN19234_c0_g1_i2.p2  ORF type:complete len:175 (-),score=47.62 TRINITY_DN19234_c0_g1_i2:39-563(-)